MKNWFLNHKFFGFLFMVIGIVLFALILVALFPVQIKTLPSPNPVQSYEQALERVDAIQSQEEANPDVNPTCHTRLLTHDQKTSRAIVFLHGFTSCPEQFAQLGDEFFQRGYNVYIPRMPGHGYNDRLGTELWHRTPEEMITFAMDSADIAQGLGDHVTFSGLSGGGALTIWLAQERQDIDLAAPIAPFTGIEFIPTPLNYPLSNLMSRLPDFFQWWDPVKKLENPYTAPYAYARYPSHALDDFMVLGFDAQRSARNTAPAAGAIIMITNAADPSVNNPLNYQTFALWQEKRPSVVDSYEFPEQMELPHDLITPTRPGNRVDLVYPKLYELLGAPQKPITQVGSFADKAAKAVR